MKNLNHKPIRQQGSVLMMIMIVTLIIGIVLASYLYLVRFQNVSVVHSQAWNASLAVAEGGVEEALAQMNPGLSGNLPNLGANGWTQSGTNYSAPKRPVGADSYYNVSIVADNPLTAPTIYATGYTTVSYSGVTAVRAVKVTAINVSLFQVAMAAQKGIDLNGNNITVDSYDSADPNKSTGGMYDPKKAQDNGDIATNSGLTNSVNAGNANIKGKVRTGPNGLPYIGAQGSIGSAAWVDGGNTGIQGGWFADDFNIEFPDVLPPFTSGAATPTGKTVGGTNYTYILGTDNYQLSSLNLKTGDKMLVSGNAVLYVTGTVNMSGSSKIIVSAGATLKIFVDGPSADFTEVNVTGNANSFQFYGLPTLTSASWNGNATFVGTIYAPQATFTLGGGGNNVMDFQGSVVVKSVTMNGKFHFHFDENLARSGPFRGFVPTSWTEL